MSDITVGSVAVDIVPDTRGFAEALKAKLSGISVDIAINADTSEARAQLEELTHARTATINANADTTQAEAQLDEAARNRDTVINARGDGRGISGLLAGALALGPALVPIAAAVTGLVAALGAPLAAAGGGLTVFGLIGGAAIAKTQKVAKQIDDLKKRAQTLVDPKAAAAAAAQAKALEASLTGPQRAFLRAKNTLSTAFETLLKSSGKDIFRPFNAGLKLLAAIMPALAPVIHSVSGALTGMLDELARSAKSGGVKSFLDFLGKMSGPVLTTFAVVLGNVATGFGGLFKAFAPVAGGLLTGLLRLSGAFADFGRNAGSNKGLQSFIGYVQKVGPQVADVFGAMVGAIVHLGIALAPLGGLALASIGIVSKIVSAIPTDAILALVSGFLGYAAAMKIIVPLVKAWAVVQALLNGTMAVNPFVVVALAVAALAAGFVLAYKHSETFRDIVNGVFKAVGAAAKFMWDNVLKPVFKIWLNTWFTIIGAIVHGAAAAFGWVKGIGGKLKDAAKNFDDFRDRVNAALDGIHSVKDIRLNVTAKQSVLISSINKPRVGGLVEGAGARGAIINRPTVLLAGESGREALMPLDRTRGNEPLPVDTSSLHGTRLRLVLANGRELDAYMETVADSRVDSAFALRGEAERAFG